MFLWWKIVILCCVYVFVMFMVNFNCDEFFVRFGKMYIEDEFDELCFEFGIEFDEVILESVMKLKFLG